MDLEVHQEKWPQGILEKKISVTKLANIIHLEHTELKVKTRLVMDMPINNEVINFRQLVTELAHWSCKHKTKDLDGIKQE
jgi:hypothetical protein